MTATPTLKAAIKARLESVLPGLVADESLPPLTEFLDYWPGMAQPERAPRVWVDIASSERGSAQSSGSTLHKYMEGRTILVAVSHAGEDPSTAGRELETFVDLVRKCVEGDQTADGNALWVRWLATDFSPNMADAGGLFREAVLTFDVPRQVRLGVQ